MSKKRKQNYELTLSQVVKLGFDVSCSLTQKGMNVLHKKDRIGNVVGESKDKTCWRVQWKGVNYNSAYHKSFIQIDLVFPIL